VFIVTASSFIAITWLSDALGDERQDTCSYY